MSGRRLRGSAFTTPGMCCSTTTRGFSSRSAYDLDFDAYFDDAIASLSGGDKSVSGFGWIDHLEDTPEGGYDAMSWEDFKNFLVSTQTEADIFANTDDASVQEIQKALRVQKAFQQVLDGPEAAQALQHPALKPLLDEAAG